MKTDNIIDLSDRPELLSKCISSFGHPRNVPNRESSSDGCNYEEKGTYRTPFVVAKTHQHHTQRVPGNLKSIPVTFEDAGDQSTTPSMIEEISSQSQRASLDELNRFRQLLGSRPRSKTRVGRGRQDSQKVRLSYPALSSCFLDSNTLSRN